MARGAAVISVGARGAPVIRVGAVLELVEFDGRRFGERLAMEATPLERWWVVVRGFMLPAGAGEGESVAVEGMVVGEAKNEVGDGQEMS